MSIHVKQSGAAELDVEAGRSKLLDEASKLGLSPLELAEAFQAVQGAMIPSGDEQRQLQIQHQQKLAGKAGGSIPTVSPEASTRIAESRLHHDAAGYVLDTVLAASEELVRSLEPSDTHISAAQPDATETPIHLVEAA